MSELGIKQREFTLMVGKLIVYTYEHGLEFTFGDAWAKTGHKENSNHYIRLAIDLNLFKEGVWLDKGPIMVKWFNFLHDYWDTIGGAKRIDDDLNHFSMEYQGRW